MRQKKIRGMEMISDQELNKALLPMRIIWLFLVLAPVFYLLAGIYLEAAINTNLDPKTLKNVKMVLYIVAFITLVITGYVRNHILARQETPGVKQPTGNNPILQKYFVSMIVALAMSESIGVYGLVLFFLGKDRTDLYLLILVSVVTMFFYFPKKEHLRILTEEHPTA